MKSIIRALVAGGTLGLVLAACGGAPTAGNAADAASPSYDGGYGVGSGNREEPADTGTGVTSAPAADTTGRGGFTVGSGN